MSIHDDIVSLCDPALEFDYDRWGRVHDHLFRRHFWLLREYYAVVPSVGQISLDAFERRCRMFLTHASVLTEVRACPDCGDNFRHQPETAVRPSGS